MTTLIIKKNDEPQPGGVVIIPPPASDEPVIKIRFSFLTSTRNACVKGCDEQTVAPARLREAIKTGIAETNAELFLWREQQIAGGFSKLADVPADDLDGECASFLLPARRHLNGDRHTL